ncbi:MAG: hypothetical protein ACQKBY_00315 [Verrucomicrobiales bacterium]
MTSYSKARIRKLVRETLAMAPGYGQTEEMLKAALDERVAGRVDLSDLRDGVEWNHGKGYVRSRVNEDTDEKEYLITEAGISKEDIK